MPLPCLLALQDVLLSSKIAPFLDQIFPQPSGVWFGAKPRTQTLDIAHGLSTVIEKSLDLKSEGAIGQADIRQFYDSNSLIRVFEYLLDKGLPHNLAAACIRHQMFPKLYIHVGGITVPVGNRSLGSLTGSRLAGVAARVPVEQTCCERVRLWRKWGFRTRRGVLTMSTYVDNLFVAGRSV